MNDVRSGDVIELGAGDDAITALVLLVTADGTKFILDRCDGTCPQVVERHEVGAFRVFRPELVAA